MFFRHKKSGKRVYLQIVENRWEQGRSKQRVIATLGRLDRLAESGQLDALLQSGARFSESVMVLAAHREGETPAVSTRRIGPAMVFSRLWEQLKLPQVIDRLLEGRRFALPVERIGERVYVRFSHHAEPLGFRLYRQLRRVFLRQLEV